MKKNEADREEITPTPQFRNKHIGVVLDLTEAERNENLIKALAVLDDSELENEAEIEKI